MPREGLTMPAIAQFTEETHINLENSEARRKLAQMVTRLFELWDLPAADQLELLGLSRTSRAQLSKYRKGGHCLLRGICSTESAGCFPSIKACGFFTLEMKIFAIPGLSVETEYWTISDLWIS